MTPRSFDHDDLGIDLARVAALPECHACRKKSDGCKPCPDETILCGTHFDAWMIERYKPGGNKISAADFARELREGKYRPCWEAKIGE